MKHKHTNELIHENSPYLLQHAHNPVNWYAWGDAALQKAKDENKLILVSIGYAACHWCHVMERESFEDENTAEIMNRNFINIKIDREERPDIDHIYMDAVQALSGSGGWPLNVFLTPDTKPFYGGTYFPPVKAFNRPSWTEVLQQIATAWSTRQLEIISQAENLTDYLHKSGSNFLKKINIEIATENQMNIDQCNAMFSVIMKSADKSWGGFGNAPKFPQTATIKYLLLYYYYTKNNDALQQALISIDKMLQGGIYDHVGGGLARYSTDVEWLAPHFEKMLYDNALLIDVLCDAFQLTKSEQYKKGINKTIHFIQQELMNPDGGFYAAFDADSEGVEGKFYVWDKLSVENILGTDAHLFCEFFDVTEKGNWEGKNILRILIPAIEFVKDKNIDIDLFEGLMENCLLKLKVERNKRVPPALDDKVILSWNGLMLKAIAKAAVVLQDSKFLQLAQNNYHFLMANFTIAGTYKLQHTWKGGIAKYPAFLDDYAFFIEASLELYNLNFDPSFLQTAKNFCEFVIENFSDEDALFFYFTHKDQKDILVRKKEVYDGATPSANAVMASNLFKLSTIFENSEWRIRANKMLLMIAETITKYPTSFGVWAAVYLHQLIGTNEITVVGFNAKQVSKILQTEIFNPVMQLAIAEKESGELPIFKNKYSGNPANIYLCKQQECKPPVSDVSVLIKIIKKLDIVNKK